MKIVDNVNSVALNALEAWWWMHRNFEIIDQIKWTLTDNHEVSSGYENSSILNRWYLRGSPWALILIVMRIRFLFSIHHHLAKPLIMLINKLCKKRTSRFRWLLSAYWRWARLFLASEGVNNVVNRLFHSETSIKRPSRRCGLRRFSESVSFALFQSSESLAKP